ncbi:hypothetical protein FH063_005578 [Azospirillum argentinense]|uniref:Uncharacterized protein n=1 Tax=Azospirillum argentinense TaxID=2970906 RepID=A0A5B0KKD1_9PROT|nr:hypothetical protein FH063_005578 [Azospirillum argentinense]
MWYQSMSFRRRQLVYASTLISVLALGLFALSVIAGG